MNLLAETRHEIEASGHTTGDIVFIGSLDSGHRCTWDEFVGLADFDYDDGFGAQKIASDLVVMFADRSMLQRSDYDGAEGWDFAPTVLPAAVHPIRTLGGEDVAWDTLAELNEENKS